MTVAGHGVVVTWKQIETSGRLEPMAGAGWPGGRRLCRVDVERARRGAPGAGRWGR